MSLASFNFLADEVKIIPFGDLHAGHPAYLQKDAEAVIEYVKNSPNTYIIGMGDLVEASNKHSVGAGWVEQTMNLDQQIDYICNLLSPVRDRVLGMIAGNHELRSQKEVGSVPTYRICREIGLKYWEVGKLIRIKVKDYNYLIYATHGDSRAVQPDSKMRACRRLRDIIDASIYCMGHVHHLAVDTSPVYEADLKDKIIIQRKKYYVLTGYFLGWWKTYAQAKNYAPGKTGVAKIKLFGDRWDTHASI